MIYLWIDIRLSVRDGRSWELIEGVTNAPVVVVHGGRGQLRCLVITLPKHGAVTSAVQGALTSTGTWSCKEWAVVASYPVPHNSQLLHYTCIYAFFSCKEWAVVPSYHTSQLHWVVGMYMLLLPFKFRSSDIQCMYSYNSPHITTHIWYKVCTCTCTSSPTQRQLNSFRTTCVLR